MAFTINLKANFFYFLFITNFYFLQFLAAQKNAMNNLYWSFFHLYYRFATNLITMNQNFNFIIKNLISHFFLNF